MYLHTGTHTTLTYTNMLNTISFSGVHIEIKMRGLESCLSGQQHQPYQHQDQSLDPVSPIVSWASCAAASIALGRKETRGAF